MATLDALEDWLIVIAQHTRETKEAIQGRGATQPKKPDDSWVDKLKDRIEGAVARGLTTGLSQARALAARGFAGTTEQAAHSYAMEQLGKQFAAIMKPIMDGMTYAAVQVERRLQAMNGTQQNRLMGGILGAGIGYKLGGLRGGIGGGLLAAGALGDNPTEGMIGGAILGARFGPIGAVVGGIGGAIAGARYNDLYKMYKGEAARDLGGESVLSRGGAGLAAAGVSVFDAFSGGAMTDHLVKSGRLAPKAAEPRRDVTPFQAEMGEAGSTAMRVQEAVIRTTAGKDFDSAGPLKPIIDLMLAIFDQLVRLGGGTPPPQSANS